MRYISKIKVIITAIIPVVYMLGSAGTAGATAQSSISGIKPVPESPILHNKTVKPPRSRTGIVRPFGGPGFTVGISAAPQNLWQNQYATITATANADVGPTPYYISVYDQTSHAELAVCGAGTTCSAAITQQSATTHSFQAYIGDYPPSNSPPDFILVTSPVVTVTWRGISIALSASQTTAAIGGTVTLSSTTSADIGPTPFYNEIFDATNRNASYFLCIRRFL